MSEEPGPGELVLFCPACPQPGVNMPPAGEVDLEEINREVEGLKQEMEKAGNELLSHHAPPHT